MRQALLLVFFSIAITKTIDALAEIKLNDNNKTAFASSNNSTDNDLNEVKNRVIDQSSSLKNATAIKTKSNSYALPSKLSQSIKIKVKERETVNLRCPVDVEPSSVQNDADDELSDTNAEENSNEEMLIKKRSISSNSDNSSTKSSPTPIPPPLLIIQWFKESVRISQLSHSSRHRPEGALLSIFNVRSLDSGKYKCKIINGFGTVTHTIDLLVEPSSNKEKDRQVESKLKEAPTPSLSLLQQLSKIEDGIAPAFIEQDKLQQRKYRKLVGDNVRLKCRTQVPSSSSPKSEKSEIIWFKNGYVLNEEDYGITRSKSVLDLNDLRLSDSGNYTCHVSNKFGYVNMTFEMNVWDSQLFEGSDSSNATILAGMDAILSCKVKNAGRRPEIKWMKQISSDEYKNYVHRSNAAVVAVAAAALSDEHSSNMLENMASSSGVHSSNYDLDGLSGEQAVEENNLNGLYSMSTISPLAIVAAAANPLNELKSSEDVLVGSSEYDLSKTSLNEIMNENSLNLRIFMPADASASLSSSSSSSSSSKSNQMQLLSNNMKHHKASMSADLTEQSVHYITLTSSPQIDQKITYNSDGNYYLSQLTIKNANTKDSGIYVCFGASGVSTAQSYNYKKSHLRVLSTNDVQINRYAPKLFDLNSSNDLLKKLVFQQGGVQQNKVSHSTDSALFPGSGGSIQLLYLAIIGVPVLFVCLFAFVSIRYLKLLDEQQKQQHRSKIADKNEAAAAATLKFNIQAGSVLQSGDDAEKTKFCCSFLRSKKKNRRKDQPNEVYKKKRADKRATAAVVAATTCCDQDTNLLPSTINSLGSSLSDSSSTTNTTVAYYATIPLLLDNSSNTNITSSSTCCNNSPPRLPNTQPPPFSPNYSKNEETTAWYTTTMSPGVVPTANCSLRQCDLERSGSTPSMAYYKIVDSDLINFNAHVYDDRRPINRAKTENGCTDEHYYQLSMPSHLPPPRPPPILPQ